MKQYLAMLRENQALGVVKLEIEGNVNSEIKSQFMRELREETFSGNKNEDAHDHVDRVLYIVSLFNIPGVSQDAVLLRVILFTLTGTAKRWVDRLTLGVVNTWDLLKKAFSQRYCPSYKTVKRLKDIYNFKQEIDESLYQAWERFNDLLYKFPTHDINIHQKVNIFYKVLSTLNKQFLNSQGPILRMTPTQALTAIQTMADHSQKWHYGILSRSVNNNINTDGLATIEAKQVEETKYREFGRLTLFNGNNGAKYRVGASISVMPKGIFDFLKLTNLIRKTNMLIEMADMTKNALLGVVENVLVGIDKILFLFDFVIIDRTPNETVILDRPFLTTVHAEIYVFDKKITLGDYSSKEWIIVQVGHTNVNESIKKALLKSWVIDYFEEALDPDKDLKGRSFDDYKWVFDLEIEQLADKI
nr:hypothetical protein [Tanacetum cinerariifolium]